MHEEEVVDQAVETEEDDDSDFEEFVARVEAAVEAPDGDEAREQAVLAKEDAELAAFSLAEIVRKGAWEDLPVGMIGDLDAEAFDAYMAWRDMHAPGDEDEFEEPERPLGSVIEPAVAGPRYHGMSESDFAEHLAGLVTGAE